MPKKNFDQQLEQLSELRTAEPSSAVPSLRKALANRNNYIVSKAAKITAELGLKDLVPDLLAALERFFNNGVKSDPQCWAKNAIVPALVKLGSQESAVFLRGLHYVQNEPTWTPPFVLDTATALRGKCILALIECRDLSDTALLSHLLELLVDPDKTVRAEAANGIGRINRPEAALLLRLRALTGDEEPEVIGACFSALLAIESEAAIGFVARFLERDQYVAEEAALALGLMRNPKAFQVLKSHYEQSPSPAPTLLTAMALSRQDEAIDFLVSLIEKHDSEAEAAIKALASAGLPSEVRDRVGVGLRAADTQLRSAFEQHFPRTESGH